MHALTRLALPLLAVTACQAQAQEQALPSATELARFSAPEAHQGVVADEAHFYAVANAQIGKYDRTSGQLVASWQGDPQVFRHMNSCIMRLREIVCAASNYPQVPMASSAEWFDADTLTHVRTRSLGPGRGSLTWLDWHDGSWWACFANYEGNGGEPGRGTAYTTVVRYTPDFTELGAWLLPQAVLDRMAPYSSSGGIWGADGLLWLTGHHLPEAYGVRLPAAGSRLELVATIAIPSPGQAIARDAGDNRRIWSIDRAAREVVLSELPPLASGE